VMHEFYLPTDGTLIEPGSGLTLPTHHVSMTKNRARFTIMSLLN
jgi:hypothetical protein